MHERQIHAGGLVSMRELGEAGLRRVFLRQTFELRPCYAQCLSMAETFDRGNG